MTTPQVIQLTHCIDLALIARLFARFRGRYGNLWTSRATCDDDWEFIMDDWLQELSKFTLEQVRAAVNKTLSEFVTYPPTLGQLVELCMKESGVPEAHEVIRLMVARDFSHPLVKMIYDKVGSWTLTNGKSEEIERKVKEHYQSTRAEFYVEPKKAWEQLESFNAKPKELPEPPKIPSNEERKGFKERLAEYYKLAEEGRTKLNDLKPIEFDEREIKPGGKQYAAYENYLLSVPEHLVLGLPPKYAYDRQRILNKKETVKHLKEAGYVPYSEREGFDDLKTSDKIKPTRMYKNWVNN